MQTKIFSLLSAALLIGGLAGCSSSDDVIDNPVPTAVSENAVGQAIDDVTAEMQSSIYNCAVSGTRATSDIDAIEKEIPKAPSFDNKVPDDAIVPEGQEANKDGATWLIPTGIKKDLAINLTNSTLYVKGTVRITNGWGSNGKIIVKKGGHVIAAMNDIMSNGGTMIVEEGGKLTSEKPMIINKNEKVYVNGDFDIDNLCIQGTLYVNGNLTAKDFSVWGSSIMDGDTRLCVTGKMTSADADLSTDGYIYR